MALLEVNNLVVKYGPITAVKGVSLKVEKGQIVAILGANGAGKSTIIRTICGVNKVAEGTIMLEGKNIANQAPYTVNKHGVLTSPEGRLLFRDLTVEENLMTGAYSLKGYKVLEEKTQNVENLPKEATKTDAGDGIIKVWRKISRAERVKENLARVYSYFPILKERNKQKASTLSGGEQQMLAIGRALMGAPKLLLLDEPSLGLAPLIIKDIFDIIKAIAREGTTVLIVEQNAFQTLKIADYAYLMELGTVKAEGKPEVLLADSNLIAAYLGGQK
ncbi:MAG: High-affinity branched-chain amino acid transport ATP-binding protein LivF [Tenericutes bacterium ADurb.Bin087]|nr:MAG: High-affinity branched-chain amino acid transport ATP-binding protein LivF [Tenericutes bacterium ADurb.Bin087]